MKDEFTFPVSYLDSHVLITGLYGIGGRELLRKIAWDVERSHPKIGILYISQLREYMKNDYPWDYYHNAKDFRLSIPYFHGSNQDAPNV